MPEVRVKSEHLEAIQATAAALVAQVQALLPEPVAQPQASGCLHPNRERAPRMGAEHAWYCPDCHEQGER